MGLAALVIYGIGDMLGAGIYGLVGKAAAELGNATWMAFLVSMIAAALTGLSYASLGSRYPRAAGTAYVVHRAFRLPPFSYVVGLAVIASGLTSMAAVSRIFAGYLQALAGAIPQPAAAVGIILLLSLVNFWGMRESSWVNILCTVVEASGLAIVVVVGLRFWGSVDYLDLASVNNPAGEFRAPLLFSAAVLAFYAFVGFEDMINVAEEVRDPRRVFPVAVLLAFGAVSLIYAAISITAVSVVPHAELARSQRPLVEVVLRAAPWFPPALYTVIALFAVSNTALINYIMGSRLVYGMARQGLLPAWLGAIHPGRHTPHRAILALMAIVLTLALFADVAALAKATSLLLLCVFVVVNAGLLALRRRAGEPRGALELPAFVPLGGIAVSAVLIANARRQEILIATFLLMLILGLYLVRRPRAVIDDYVTGPREE